MNRHTERFAVRCSEWILRRNPFYLLSAVIMAFGARLLLVSPDDVAGDLGLIVITLSVLQVYEWAVAGVLVLLARSGRSPEDRSWLLLVAAAFWTGPLAATVELTIAHPSLGLAIAAGAGVIAMGELLGICRRLHLRMSARGHMVGLACQSLVVLTPYILRWTASDNALRELVLFGSWWALGAIALLPFATIIARPAHPTDLSRSRHDLRFAAITLAATMLHLVGMNHAFYCHAKLFYAAPFLAAVSVLGLRCAKQTTCLQPHILLSFASLPALSIIFSIETFARPVPVHAIPPWLRDPMLTSTALAFVVWLYGWLLHRYVWLLHAAAAGLGLGLWRVGVLTGLPGTQMPGATASIVASHPLVVSAAYVTTTYLLAVAWWQRSRGTALVAVAVHLVGFSVLVSHRITCDTFLIGVAAGWSALAAIHLARDRSPLTLRLLPILWLAALSWSFDATSSVMWVARAHAGCAVVALYVVGSYWRWTRYRTVAVTCGCVYLTCQAARLILTTPQAAPLIVVLAAFVLLAAGGVISWHKPRLLNWIRRIGG